MNRIFIDVNIPMYAGGTAHPLRESSQLVIRSIASGRLDAVTDAEIFQEILYRYFHIGERVKGCQIFDLFHRIMAGRVLPIEDRDIQRARDLADDYPMLGPRDLIHVAVMTRYDIRAVITADKGFERVQDIRRIDPSKFKPPQKNP